MYFTKTSSTGIGRVAVAVIVIVIIVIAGGAAYYITVSKPTSTTSSSTTSTTAPVSTSSVSKSSTPIYLADVEELSGADAVSGTQVDEAVQFAASQVNAAGGVDIRGVNYTVDVVPVDITSDVSNAPSLISTALSEHNFSGVISDTDFSNQLNGVFESAKMPFMNNAVEPSENSFNYSFETSTDVTGITPITNAFFKWLNAVSPVTNIGIICDNTGFGQAFCPAFNATAYYIGQKPLLDTTVNTPMTAADAAPLATKILSLNVKFVILPILDVGSVELLIETLRGDGYTGAIMGNGPAYSGGTIRNAVGSAINGLFDGDCCFSDLTPALTSYIQGKTGQIPLGAAIAGYGQFYIYVYAMIAAQSAKVQDVWNELKVIHITSGEAYRVFGGFGPVDFSTTSHRGNDSSYFAEWINGSQHTIFPTSFATAKVVWPLPTSSVSSTLPIVKANSRPTFNSNSIPETFLTEQKWVAF